MSTPHQFHNNIIVKSMHYFFIHGMKLTYIKKQKGGGEIMAKAINATPILSGKSADKFVARLNEPPSQEKKEFLAKAREIYKIVQSNKDG
jgi:hypothetical protein